MLSKMNVKPKPEHKLNKKELSLYNEGIIDYKTDLAKLIFALNTGLQWPEEEDIDLKQFVVQNVIDFFDESGEMAAQSCFDMAVDYGFIVLETDPKTRFKKYRVCERHELDLSHDWFCFRCDVLVSKKSQQFLRCSQCTRIYHRKCEMEFLKTDNQFICDFCNRVKGSDIYLDYKRVSQKRVNRLLRFLLDFTQNEMKGKYKDIDKDFNNYVFVYKNIDLNKIREKAERDGYKTLEEFDDDFFYFMHNISITQINFDDIIGNFVLLRTYLVDEMRELTKCVDCYERVNDKELKETNKEWVCLPCSPFHRPVFAKCKSLPFWPAKVLLTDDKNNIEVCLFEAEKAKEKKKRGQTSTTLNKFKVKSNDIREIDDKEVIHSIKGNQRLVKPLNLFIKYLQLMPIKDPMTDATIEMIRSAIEPKQVSDSPSVPEELYTPSKSKPKPPVEAKNSLLLPTPQSSGTKKSQKSAKKKAESKTPNKASIRSSSPQITCLSDDLSKDSVDNIVEKVPDINISDILPVVDSMKANDQNSGPSLTNSKRRSGRIAAQITPQMTESEAKKKSIKKNKKINKNKELDTISMEVDGEDSQQNSETNQSFVDMNSKPIESTDTEVIASAAKPEVMSFDMSPAKESSTNQTSTVSSTVSTITTTLANNSISQTTLTSTEVVPSTSSSPSTPEVSQSSSDTVTPGKRFTDRLNQLLAMSGPMIPKLVMDETLVLLNHYHNQQINSLKRQIIQNKIDFSKELKEAKTKWWCAVCQKLGTHYCCVRFYCSRECQLLDWANGHNVQCLMLKEGNRSQHLI